MTILSARTARSLQGGRSFTLGNLLYRISWALVWRLFASWTPPQMAAWRRILLLMFGAKLHKTAKVYGSARIWSPANLAMEQYACIGPHANIYSMALITLESYALISQGGHLCAGTHNIEDPHFQLVARPIRIGSRAWIAAEAFVGPGVTIGEGAVLGARACAMKDIAPWTVNSGNPARMIRMRTVNFG